MARSGHVVSKISDTEILNPFLSHVVARISKVMSGLSENENSVVLLTAGTGTLAQNQSSGQVETTELLNIQYEDEYYRHGLLGTILVIISYALIFIVGIIGNTCVLFVAAKIPKMRTVTNYFIFNLALADLCVVVFCVAPSLVSNIFTRKLVFKLN